MILVLACVLGALVAYAASVPVAIYIAARFGRAGVDEAIAVGFCWPVWVAVQPAMSGLRLAVGPVAKRIRGIAQQGERHRMGKERTRT